MGDNISVSFVRTGPGGWRRESVALFSHQDGARFAREAERYAADLIAEQLAEHRGGVLPLGRLEPSTVMVDFIGHLFTGQYGIEPFTEGGRVRRNLYLGRDEHDGANDDNGHFTVDLDAMMAEAARRQEAAT